MHQIIFDSCIQTAFYSIKSAILEIIPLKKLYTYV